MDTPTMQRVRSHGASLNARAFELADRFLDAYFAACPHLRAPENRFRGTPDRQRRGVAHQWAWFVRHLGELDHVSPELDALASYLKSRGVSTHDFRTARGALIEALRDLSGPQWTGQLENDWNAAFEACLHHMCPSQPHALPGTSTSYAVAA
jgi:hemoglobin-like flavoprotein